MGCRSGHNYSLSHYVDEGKVASFCNSGTRDWANCIRVFEFDDYSARDYSRANPPRALLIAKFDLEPGTQALLSPAPSAPPACPVVPVSHAGRAARRGAGAVGLRRGRNAGRAGGA